MTVAGIRSPSYNSGVPTDPNSRAYSMGEGSTSHLMKLRRNIAQESSGSYSHVPGLGINDELGKFGEVHGDGVIRPRTTEA